MKKYLFILLLLANPAYADSTIDALSAAAALAGTENVPIFQTANPAVKTTTGAIGNAGALTGDIIKSAGSGATTLKNTGPGATGPLGSATAALIITIDAQGRVTALSSATITPAIGNVTGLGTGVSTALGINIGSAGAPITFNGAGGTPSSMTGTNITGLPIAGIAGLGTGVGTALAVNIGNAGAFVTFNGALGTPSSGTATNITGLPIAGITGLGTGVGTALGTNLSAAGGLTSTIASGTSVLGTSAISSATCATVVTTAATNTATTDVVLVGFNGDPTAVTGYVPLTAGMLTIISYPTSGNVNHKVCNNTSSSITPGAITLNWRVVR